MALILQSGAVNKLQKKKTQRDNAIRKQQTANGDNKKKT